jgi:putative RNA 2'-phosphotransferase
MTHPALIERITRSLAYMLRHQPEEFDLELDAHGYGDAERVVQALNERLGEPVTLVDLEDAIHAGDRPRYELVGNRVRALYGHSIDVEPGEPTRPPEFLFVGISARDADRATRYGLRGGRRRFLHLALTPEDAKEAGRRTGRDYVVITVYALDAWEEGINFYDRKALFLAGQIPTEFLEVTETCHDGIEPEVRPGGGRRDFPERGRDQRPRGGRHGNERGHDRGPRRGAPAAAESRSGGYEEEGFGETSAEAIHVERDRGPRQAEAPHTSHGAHGAHGAHGGDFQGRADSQGSGRSHGDHREDGRDRGHGDRGDRGGRTGPRSHPEEHAPAAGAPMHAEGAREEERPRGENRSRGEGGGQHGRHRDRGGRAPRGPEDRGFERPARPEGEFGAGGRQERGGPPQDAPREWAPERSRERPRENSPERARESFPERARENFSDRPPQRPPERVDRPQERAPERAAPPAQGSGDPGFGLGIFEEPSNRAPRAAPAPRAPTPPPAPPTPPPAPKAERDPFDGFGAGV